MADHQHSIFTSEHIATAERVRGILRAVDMEAVDARNAAVMVTLCVEKYVGKKLPMGDEGADVIVITDDEAEILTHQAHQCEGSIRRVSDAISEASTIATELPASTVVAFDPIIGQIAAYRRAVKFIDRPDVDDDDATSIHAEAIAPFAQDKPPVVLSRKGALEAVRLVLSFGDVDKVDANILRGVVSFLEGRAG